MLFVKTKVAPSSIEGFGLFAAEPIDKGRLIAQFDTFFGWQATLGAFELLHPIAKDFVRRYGWRKGVVWFMDIDDSRFMNHSFTPNMDVCSEHIFIARAARDIREGEELTEDYRTFDPDFDSYGKNWK